MKGLVMEGGAMRGMFTCGVLDVLMENNVTFDGAAGISAGAVFGCNFKSRQIGRGIRYNKKYANDKRYCSVKNLITTGDLYGVEFCYHTLPNELDPFDTETFSKNPMDFYIGATNVTNAEAVFYKCRDGGARDLEWMRASASMPVVSKVVNVDGYKLLDGGIVCPVPYAYMQGLGYDKNVIILTQPKGYRKEKSKMTALMKPFLRKYPAMVTAMETRYLTYNKQMDELDKMEETKEALIIRPAESLGISRTESDPDELERVYRLGRTEGLCRLNEIQEYLKSDFFADNA